MKHLILGLLILLVTHSLYSQEESAPESYQGLAIDIFPLINQIFSDDVNSSLFELTHLWGKGDRRYEFGIAPQFRKIESDDDNISDFNTFGAALSFFHGKQFSIGKSWLGAWGMSYRYRYNEQNSKSERSQFDFKIKTSTHEVGLGPQLMFGFQISESIHIRSRIAALLEFDESRTKIKDGGFEAGDQKVTNYNFGIKPPQVIDLILFF